MIKGTQEELDAHIGAVKTKCFTSDLYPHILEEDYKDIPLLWYNNSPFLTSYENALSCALVSGEHFMVETMTEAIPHLHFDEKLSEADVRGFCDQELNHAEAHNTFNLALKSTGFDLDGVYLESAKLFDKYKELPLGEKLQLTALLETVTSLMSSYILRTFPDSDIYLPVKNLYLWHCVEELEHRDSAYYACTNYHGPGFRPSKRNILYILKILVLLYKYTFSNMWRQKCFFKLRNIGDIARFFLSKKGFGRFVLMGLLRFFFTKGYDPQTQFDDKELNAFISNWEAEYHKKQDIVPSQQTT